MLWLTLGGLVALVAGLIIIKVTEETFLGLLLAIIGAVAAIALGIATVKLDARNAAKCESYSGSYGGDVCYVSGVEKDLKEIGL